jgi:hypothetical protein
MRPFIFHLLPFLGVVLCSNLLTVLIDFIEVFSGVLNIPTRMREPEIELRKTLQRQIFWPGRFSSWMSVFSGFVVGVGMLWLKYGWIGPDVGFASIMLMPRSPVDISDLDRAVAAMSGMWLFFSACGKPLRNARRQKREFSKGKTGRESGWNNGVGRTNWSGREVRVISRHRSKIQGV